MSLFEGAKASLLIVPSSPSFGRGEEGEGGGEGPGFCIVVVIVVVVVEANSSMPRHRRTTNDGGNLLADSQ